MDRREEDFEIPWPSFVDILSSVIITFIFFLLLVIIILSQMVEKEKVKIQEEREFSQEDNTAKTPTVEQDQSDPYKRNEKLEETIEEMEMQIANLRTALARATEQSIEESETSLMIFYQRNEVSLTPESVATIERFVQQFGAQMAEHEFVLETTENPTLASKNLTREQSLARSLNVRNVLLKNTILPANMRIQNTHEGKIEGSYDWVRLSYRPKQDKK